MSVHSQRYGSWPPDVEACLELLRTRSSFPTSTPVVSTGPTPRFRAMSPGPCEAMTDVVQAFHPQGCASRSNPRGPDAECRVVTGLCRPELTIAIGQRLGDTATSMANARILVMRSASPFEDPCAYRERIAPRNTDGSMSALEVKVFHRCVLKAARAESRLRRS